MNYSYTLIIHYSLKNFLIVDNYDISVYNISGGGGGFHPKNKVSYIMVYPI